MLISIYFLVLTLAFSCGAAAFMAAIQVYFRDAVGFLPYFLRIWMYLSPVLWSPAEFGPGSSLYWVMLLNPMYSICGGWGDALMYSRVPDPMLFLVGFVWAAVVLVAGSLFFMSRERDFAVRI
jgi:ABC-type polysaccharide/polyol phosphate export permease